MHIQLTLCLTAGLLTSAIYSAQPYKPDLKARKAEDLRFLEQAFEAGSQCNVYPIIKAAEYLAERYEEETDPDHLIWLRQAICLVYVSSPVRCPSSASQQQIVLALQQQLTSVQKRNLERLKKKNNL